MIPICVRRRGRRVTSSTDDGTTEDTNSITETEDSSNEEIKVYQSVLFM